MNEFKFLKMISRVRIDTAQHRLCFYDIFVPWQNTFQLYRVEKVEDICNFCREPGLLFTFMHLADY